MCDRCFVCFGKVQDVGLDKLLSFRQDEQPQRELCWFMHRTVGPSSCGSTVEGKARSRAEQQTGVWRRALRLLLGMEYTPTFC